MPYPLLDLGGTVKVGVSPGSRESHKPRVKKAPFGNGYTQRSADGINADAIVFTVRWTNLKRSESNFIKAFLAERQGLKPFRWQMPGDSTPRQWVCEEWDRDLTDKAIDSMSAVFGEDFQA